MRSNEKAARKIILCPNKLTPQQLQAHADADRRGIMFYHSSVGSGLIVMCSLSPIDVESRLRVWRRSRTRILPILYVQIA